ncbi:MAG: transglycosylase domain-containing protein [Myxococcaceae bacterium]|nr:transglycosylase domain-containing protein [Myxococcaceae bacterium]
MRRRVASGAVLALGALGLTFWASLDARLVSPSPSHVLLDRRGHFLGEVPASDEMLGYWPLPAVLPDKLVTATLETEDRFFYEHPGVHAPSLARAVVQNLRSASIISGASTVAMQVARLQHPRPRGLWAKVHEAAEALLLVDAHGRDRVLRQYLTVAPYGNRARGAARAARLYFDKPVEDLSWLQASFLAALPQQPGRMNPYDPDGLRRALQRTHRILRLLHQRGVIDAVTLDQALGAPLGLVPQPKRDEAALHVVLDFAADVARGGMPLVSTSSVDLEVQRIATRAVAERVRALSWARAGNGAALVVDLPTGEVLARAGSTSWADAAQRGSIDYTRTRRSPGSALKPFVYALALERGTHTPASPVPDVPLELVIGDGSAWVPENMTHTFMGPMLFREALASSRNIPALRVLEAAGVDRTLELLRRGGVKNVSHEPGEYGLTLAIGGLPVTAEELATLYTALANRGVTLPLQKYVNQTSPGVRLFSPDTAAMISHVLWDPNARRSGFPAGSALDYDDYAVAVKTGTSQGYRDAWAAAFSDRLLVVAWVGNHDQARMNRLSGAVAAAPIAHDLLDAVMPLRAPHREWATTFGPPAGYVAHEICALSGAAAGPRCPSARTEWFPRGAGPSGECPFHRSVDLDARNGLLAGPTCPKEHVVSRALLALPPLYEAWARREKLDVAPSRESPLCPAAFLEPRKVALAEPKDRARYLFDPDTPTALAGVKLWAQVTPATEDVVFLVDGVPVGSAAWPHELRTTLGPGTHVIRAALAHGGEQSAPVTVTVDD